MKLVIKNAKLISDGKDVIKNIHIENGIIKRIVSVDKDLLKEDEKLKPKKEIKKPKQTK